ncbi:MAG: hypothetical protein ACFCU7_16015 [Pleurocapsa sp.]
MTERQRAIGSFDNPLNTEAALKELDNSHFSLDRVLVIAHNLEGENQIVGTELGESLRDRFEQRISSVAKHDSDPSQEPTVISLTQALTQLDIPLDAARSYNDLVTQGKYLVMVEGNQGDISGAKTILKRCGIQDWTVYKVVLEHPEVIIVDHREALS